MKVLVSGATGFIGQYVIKNLLLRPNIEVIATARSLSKANNLEFYDKVDFVKIDLSLPCQDVFRKLGQPDVMIHLAWDGLPNYGSIFHINKNLVNNILFINAMIESGLKDLTVTGTCLEYGMVEGELSESMITDPVNPYSIAKDSLRKFIQALSLTPGHSFSFKWLRLFYMYGEGQSDNSLFSQINAAILRKDHEFNMSRGEQQRDFQHVTTVANQIVECSLQKKVDGVINCCKGEPITVKEFIEDYLRENHYKLKLKLGFYPYSIFESMAFWGDNTKLRGVF